LGVQCGNGFKDEVRDTVARPAKACSNGAEPRGTRVPFDVFISYSSKDKPIADAACAALEAASIRCWIAPRDCSPGRDYGESIIDAIQTARAFVLIFSSNANASPQIKREVERAVTKGLPIIPVRIEDAAPNRTLEYFISSPHWLDAFPPPLEQYFAKLTVSVRALLNTEKSGTPQSTTATALPAPREQRLTSRRRLSLMIGLAAAAFVLVVAGGYALYLVESQPLVRTLTGPTKDAVSVAFSPDGNLIAAGDGNGTLYIWSTAQGQLQGPVISDFTGHAAPFSHDGKWIAAGSGSTVKIWDVVTRRVLRTFSGHSAQLQSVAFSRDGTSLVSGGTDHMVFIWDLSGNAPGRRFEGHSDLVYSVAFSSDGKRIASASFDRKVIVWDVASGQPLKMLPGSHKMMTAIFSSDDERLATAGMDGNVTVWDTSNWQVIRLLPGNGQMVTTTAFSRGDKLIASGGDDRTVKVWNPVTGTLVRAYGGHTSTVWAVEFSPDSKWIASASGDMTVKIWRVPRID
jgi:WD40 repeat protein